MPEVLVVLGVATLTVLATGLGALPVLALGQRADRARPWLDGLVIGVMGVAAIVGLLLPAAGEGSAVAVVAGACAGAGGLSWARRRLRRRHDGGVVYGKAEQQARLTFGVLLVHSLPEGLALGSAMAADVGGLAAFVVIAVAIQNVPEGTATAAAMLRAGRSRAEQVRAAVVTSAPQVPGALLAWVAVDMVDAVLPLSLAAAGAAMLLLVCVDLVPSGWRSGAHGAITAGALVGGGLMTMLALVLRPPV